MKKYYNEMALRTAIVLEIPFMAILYKTIPEHKTDDISFILLYCFFCFIFSSLLTYFVVFLVFLFLKAIGKVLSHSFDAASAVAVNSSKKISHLSDFQKIALGLSFVSLVFLGISIWAIVDSEEIGNGFYVFLRIILFGSLICLCFERFSVWWKVILILDAIVFNPFIQIHLGDRDSWLVFDIISLFVMVLSWFILFWKKKVNNSPSQTE